MSIVRKKLIQKNLFIETKKILQVSLLSSLVFSAPGTDALPEEKPGLHNNAFVSGGKDVDYFKKKPFEDYISQALDENTEGLTDPEADPSTPAESTETENNTGKKIKILRKGEGSSKEPATTGINEQTSVPATGENNNEKKEKPARAFFNGYFRAMARSDFGYNSPTLGWWPLYGRLMNETPWMMAEAGFHTVMPEKKSDPRATVVMKVEGGSFRNTDAGMGSLSNYRITQMYLETENVVFRHFITQTGTLWYNMGYIGIYDMYVAQTMWETAGFRAGHRWDTMEYFVGIGDSGYHIHEQRKGSNSFANIKNDIGYTSVPTAGALYKVNLHKFSLLRPVTSILKHLQSGISFMYFYEPASEGNPNAPHQTQGIDIQDIMRQQSLEKYFLANPGQEENFPWPEATSASSFRGTWWLGFALGVKMGPVSLNWSDLSVQFVKKHPDVAVTESYNGVTRDIYITEFTDEKYEFQIVNETAWTIWPGLVDMNIGLAFGKAWDNDNLYRPDDANRTIMSFVIRPQVYITRDLHILTEVSYAREKSTRGYRYREHYDSIQSNIGGVPDDDGLEWGDTDTKHTWQFKVGPIISPAGKGINTRPQIRLLYGVQNSNVHAAFGTSYDESLERRNVWNRRQDLHWHHMVSLEVEHWFSS